MGHALSTGTAKLPEVMPAPGATALGEDTVSAILSGIIYGTAGAVERIIAEVEALEGVTYRVVVTGGGRARARAFRLQEGRPRRASPCIKGFEADIRKKHKCMN